jgi:hypothetical protein
VLLSQTQLFHAQRHEPGADDMFGEGRVPLSDISEALVRLGLPVDAPLTVLTAETFGRPIQDDPLGAGLGHGRIMRVSPLVAVPDAC